MKKQGAFRKIFTSKAFAITAALTLGSCIAENMEDCPVPVRLLISTDHERMLETRPAGYVITDRTTRTPIEGWYTDIRDVNLYVFDGNDRFVKFWQGGVYTIGYEYEVPLAELNLREGVYNFVVWTNHGDSYSQYNSNLVELSEGREPITRGDLRMNITVPEDGDIREDFAHRHYGRLDNVRISPLDTRGEPYIIEVGATTHKVNFTVGMYSSLYDAMGFDADDSFEITVTDRNNAHSFDNRWVEGSAAYRQIRTMERLMPAPEPELSDDEQGTRAEEIPDLAASLVLMQIHDRTDTSFEIASTDGNVLWPAEDLVNLIKMVYSANGAGRSSDAEWDEFFEYQREFEIDLTVVSEFIVDLNINGWKYRLNRTPLG